MIITSAAERKKIPASQQVNVVGRKLYQWLDGAFKFKVSPNMFDVYVTLLYREPYVKNVSDPEIYEMTLDLNITTYQNKIRVNVIELSPEERTLGFDVYEPESLYNLENGVSLIYRKVCKRISRAYRDYEFLF